MTSYAIKTFCKSADDTLMCQLKVPAATMHQHKFFATKMINVFYGDAAKKSMKIRKIAC